MQLKDGQRMVVVKIYSTCVKTTARMCPVTGNGACRTLVYAEGDETKYGNWVTDQTESEPATQPTQPACHEIPWGTSGITTTLVCN
jgi:hypothetical protein